MYRFEFWPRFNNLDTVYSLLCSADCSMFGRFNTIPACNRRTDGRKKLLYQYHAVHRCAMLTRDDSDTE